MNMQEKVQDMIKSIKPNVVAFDAKTNLQESEILDSVAMVELVLWIEETFDFVVESDDLTPEKFSTVESIAAYIDINLEKA